MATRSKSAAQPKRHTPAEETAMLDRIESEQEDKMSEEGWRLMKVATTAADRAVKKAAKLAVEKAMDHVEGKIMPRVEENVEAPERGGGNASTVWSRRRRHARGPLSRQREWQERQPRS